MTDETVWVLVPKVATEAMVASTKAAFGEVNNILVREAARNGGGRLKADPVPAAYTAMISAAPQPSDEVLEQAARKALSTFYTDRGLLRFADPSPNEIRTMKAGLRAAFSVLAGERR